LKMGKRLRQVTALINTGGESFKGGPVKGLGNDDARAMGGPRRGGSMHLTKEQAATTGDIEEITSRVKRLAKKKGCGRLGGSGQSRFGLNGMERDLAFRWNFSGGGGKKTTGVLPYSGRGVPKWTT